MIKAIEKVVLHNDVQPEAEALFAEVETVVAAIYATIEEHEMFKEECDETQACV